MTIATTAALVRLARCTRAFVTDPGKNWCLRRDPERDVLQGVRVHAPDALDYFGVPGVLAAALTIGTVCLWCQAFVRAATAGKRLPANEAMLELLGRPCDRCARLIFRQVTDSLEAAMAVPLDVPSPGSVDATRNRGPPACLPPAVAARPPNPATTSGAAGRSREAADARPDRQAVRQAHCHRTHRRGPAPPRWQAAVGRSAASAAGNDRPGQGLPGSPAGVLRPADPRTARRARADPRRHPTPARL